MGSRSSQSYESQARVSRRPSNSPSEAGSRQLTRLDLWKGLVIWRYRVVIATQGSRSDASDTAARSWSGKDDGEDDEDEGRDGMTKVRIGPYR